MNKNNYKINQIKKLDEKLISEWKALWERADNANVYNSYEWYLTCKEIGKHEGKYIFYVCYQKNSLVAIIPMAEYKVFGVSVLGTLNKEHIIDTGFLMEHYNKEIVKAFFEDILKNKSVYLQKVDSTATGLLHDVFPNLLINIMSVNPTISLQGDPFANVSASVLSQVRRYFRKYKDNLDFKLFTTSLDKRYDEMLKIQKDSSKSKNNKDIFEEKETEKYYRALTKFCAKYVLFTFLYYDKKPIGYIYGLVYRGTYLGDQIAYHDDFKKISPGKLMVYSLIDKLREININMIDEGGGISDYKMSFTKDYRVLYNVYYSPNIFIMLWWRAINTARRIKQIVSPLKYTRDHEFLFKEYSPNQ